MICVDGEPNPAVSVYNESSEKAVPNEVVQIDNTATLPEVARAYDILRGTRQTPVGCATDTCISDHKGKKQSHPTAEGEYAVKWTEQI